MEIPVLKPCPFCNGTDLKIREASPGHAPPHMFPEHVSCNSCKVHFTGPGSFLKWNRRGGEITEEIACSSMASMVANKPWSVVGRSSETLVDNLVELGYLEVHPSHPREYVGRQLK